MPGSPPVLYEFGCHVPFRQKRETLRKARNDDENSLLIRLELGVDPPASERASFLSEFDIFLRDHPKVDAVEIFGGDFLPSTVGTAKSLTLDHQVRSRSALAETLRGYDSLLRLHLTGMFLPASAIAALGELNVERLDLGHSYLAIKVRSLPFRGPGLNAALKSLDVSECSLVDEQLHLLVASLRDHPTLEELDVSFNKCGRRGMVAISDLLSSSTPVTKLVMSFLAFGQGKSLRLVDEFCSALASNRTLRELECGGNGLRDADLPGLAAALCSPASGLRSIDLSQNRFADLSALAARLGAMRSLRSRCPTRSSSWRTCRSR